MVQYQKYTQEQRDKARELYLAETSVRDISLAVGAPAPNIRYWIKDLVPEIKEKKDERLEAAISLIKDGTPIKEAVELTGLSYQTIYNRTKSIRGTRRHHSKEMIAEAVEEFNNGSSVKNISKKYGVPTVTVYSWLRKFKQSSGTDDDINKDSPEIDDQKEMPRAVSESEVEAVEKTVSFFDLEVGVNISVDDEDDYNALAAFEQKLIKKSRLRLVPREPKSERKVFDLWGHASKAEYSD